MLPRRAGFLALFWAAASCGGGGGGMPDGGIDGRADGPAATGDGGRPGLFLQVPGRVPVGVPFPVVVRTSDGSPATGPVVVAGVGAEAVTLQLHRGRGSASAAALTPGAGRVTARRSGEEIASRDYEVAGGVRRRMRGALAPADLLWRGNEEILLEGDVTVPAGTTLVIEAGALVVGEPRANLLVAGTLDARGTADRPVLFSRATDAPWGGIDFASGSKGALRQVLLTAGGGDDRRLFGHSSSQAVLFAGAGSDVLVEGGGAIDNPGKAYSSAGATLTLRDVLVSRCDQGGEHDDSTLTIERSHFVEIPDADGVATDDDNDGIYLSSGRQGVDGTRPMIVRDTVLSGIEDDGIDHAGALLTVERVWIDRAGHEGMATSNGGRVWVSDTVVRRCAQGLEVGWGWPDVTVEHSAFTENGVGLRWGDEYSTKNDGKLAARYVASFGNRIANVKNFWDFAAVAAPEAVQISCSLVASPEWDGRANNGEGEVALDDAGCVSPAPRLLPGCAAGPVGPRCGK